MSLHGVAFSWSRFVRDPCYVRGPCPAIARVLFRVTACRCLSFQCIAWPALLMRLVHYLALCGRCCVHLSL